MLTSTDLSLIITSQAFFKVSFNFSLSLSRSLFIFFALFFPKELKLNSDRFALSIFCLSQFCLIFMMSFNFALSLSLALFLSCSFSSFWKKSKNWSVLTVVSEVVDLSIFLSLFYLIFMMSLNFSLSLSLSFYLLHSVLFEKNWKHWSVLKVLCDVVALIIFLRLFCLIFLMAFNSSLHLALF